MVAWAPVFGSVEGVDGEAMGYRPGREHVVELEGARRTGPAGGDLQQQLDGDTDTMDIDSAPTILIS